MPFKLKFVKTCHNFNLFPPAFLPPLKIVSSEFLTPTLNIPRYLCQPADPLQPMYACSALRKLEMEKWKGTTLPTYCHSCSHLCFFFFMGLQSEQNRGEWTERKEYKVKGFSCAAFCISRWTGASSDWNRACHRSLRLRKSGGGCFGTRRGGRGTKRRGRG